MARYCDICGEKIGWKAFHCQDGKVCKKCYGVVSNNFTQPITFRTIDELKRLHNKNSAPIDLGEGGFVTTRKIGTFLLIDEQNKKFCIPGNPTVSGRYSRPQVYRYEQLQGFKIETNPSYDPEELAGFVEDKKNSYVIKTMKVRIRIKDEGIRDIFIIPSAVRSSSYAYRKSYSLAMEVLNELNIMYQEGQNNGN